MMMMSLALTRSVIFPCKTVLQRQNYRPSVHFFPSSPFLVTGQKYEDTKIILIYYKACCLTKQHSRCVK